MRLPTLFILPLFVLSTALYCQIPAEQILRGLELGIQERYEKSLQLFTRYQEKFPADPAPYFFKASIIQSRMMDFETQHWRNDFISLLDQAADLSDSLRQQHPQNLDYPFYYGASLAYKSFQLSREGKYLAGIRLATKAIHMLENVLEKDSTYYDAYLGLGSYKYWRSYLTRHFTWLPFFSDQREEGIYLIQQAYEHSRFSKWAALSNLAWIYIQEERYEEAIECAEAGLKHFPESRFFLWPHGDALYYHGDYEKALHTYNALLSSLTAEQINNRYNEVVLHLKIAQCHVHLQNTILAQQHAQRVLQIDTEPDIEKRLKDKRRDAAALVANLNQQD